MVRCYLFDIDGTVADVSHRLRHIQKQPKDWRAFFAAVQDDLPIPHMIDLARRLRATTPRRPCICARLAIIGLTNLVKSDLLDQILADGFEPIMVFDDRNQVVEMWRSRGVPCAQVAAGDF